MKGVREEGRLFDEWPDQYDIWFTTPIGALVRKFEGKLLLILLKPSQGEIILDAGCGTGVFTLDILSFGTHVIGLDISLPMLMRAGQKTKGYHFQMVLGDMSSLPFPEKTSLTKWSRLLPLSSLRMRKVSLENSSV